MDLNLPVIFLSLGLMLLCAALMNAKKAHYLLCIRVNILEMELLNLKNKLGLVLKDGTDTGAMKHYPESGWRS